MRFLWLAVLGLVLAGCVRKDVYDDALASLAREKQINATGAAQLAELRRDVEAAKARVAALEQDVAARDARLGDDAAKAAERDRKIDDLVALNGELTQRLQQAGQSAEKLVAERGSLAQALADTRARLEELRKQQAAAEARAAEFRELQRKFQKLTDAGKLRVALRGGRMILELPNDVLFESGDADVKDEGKKALADVATVLRAMPDRAFQVAGHTDDVKIKTARFPSNWELSAARAVNVVKLLVERGMSPKNLSAAGYGEFAPVAGNDAPEGRAKNRRIEITLVPNLDELVKVAEPAKP